MTLSHICSIPFLNRLVIWLDIYKWSRRDPGIIKRASDALRFSAYTSSTACRNIKNLNHAHDTWLLLNHCI